MSPQMVGLLLTLSVCVLLLLLVVVAVLLFPDSALGPPAHAVLKWIPPFLGGKALRDWAATIAEQTARRRLAEKRTGETADRLVAEMEDAAMHAMLPLAEREELERIVPCPDTGQGRIGVTPPEAIAIAAYIRKHRSAAEQERILALAEANARTIAARVPGTGNPLPHPCALQGSDHVCCVYSERPLRCRPLHAVAIARDLANSAVGPSPSPVGPGHENAVAEGIEIGMVRAMKASGVDGRTYELNAALATAMKMPDAAERWAKGESLFDNPLR